MSFTSCPTQCVVLPPNYAAGACERVVQQGGISNFVITACDVPDLSLLTIEQICEYVQQGKITLSPVLLGQKDEAETESSDTDSCSAATITGYTHTIAFDSYEFDPVNFTNYTYWNFLKSNYKRFNWYYITCDGLLYGRVPSPTFSVSQMAEVKNTQKAGHRGTLSWLRYEDLVPVRISGLTQALQGGCVDGETGFQIDVPFGTELAGVAGSGTPVSVDELEIIRQTCTEEIVITITEVNTISGGQNPPVATTVNIAGPAGTTGGEISFNLLNADPGVYDFVYLISACDDTFTGVVRVTVTAS